MAPGGRVSGAVWPRSSSDNGLFSTATASLRRVSHRVRCGVPLPPAPACPARIALRGRQVAGGDGDGGARWNYGAPPDGNPGREAWMVGGGEDTQVVYVSPRQRR